jgi:hypothetical protein
MVLKLLRVIHIAADFQLFEPLTDRMFQTPDIVLPDDIVKRQLTWSYQVQF